MRSLLWFRGKELRTRDNRLLREGATGEMIPVFVADSRFFDRANAAETPHRLQFLIETLGELAEDLRAKGSRLLIARGPSQEVIPDLVRRFKVGRVLAYRWTEPFGRKRDEDIATKLSVPLELLEGETLLPPESVRTKGGTPYAVYTPFANAARDLMPSFAPASGLARLPALPKDVELGDEDMRLPTLEELGLERNPALQTGGESAARDRLDLFLMKMSRYKDARDALALSGTSRLSADLKFGLLSVQDVWTQVEAAAPSDGRTTFLSQLLWREFAYSILWDRPEILETPFRPAFADFPWSRKGERLDWWTQGETGYPIVDAAARQLLQEGYVHNRARMITASFLTKHLLVHYAEGEAHYLKFLTDGDWALNNMGWQWSAGCGVDAQPYFRVFNPMSQGAKFDKSGEYVKRYLPELKGLPGKWIHTPWEAPPNVLRGAGISLGKTYPRPIVEHKEARARFLDLAKTHLKK